MSLSSSHHVYLLNDFKIVVSSYLYYHYNYLYILISVNVSISELVSFHVKGCASLCLYYEQLD